MAGKGQRYRKPQGSHLSLYKCSWFGEAISQRSTAHAATMTPDRGNNE